MVDQRVPHAFATSNGDGCTIEVDGKAVGLVGKVGICDNHGLTGKKTDGAAVFCPSSIRKTVTVFDLPNPCLVAARALKPKPVRRGVPNSILSHNQTVDGRIGQGQKRFTIHLQIDKRDLKHLEERRLRIEVGPVLAKRSNVFTVQALKPNRG